MRQANSRFNLVPNGEHTAAGADQTLGGPLHAHSTRAVRERPATQLRLSPLIGKRAIEPKQTKLSGKFLSSGVADDQEIAPTSVELSSTGPHLNLKR